MAAFTRLELAALRSIFSETPGLAPALERQVSAAAVTGRENSGSGFFTTIAVARDAPGARCPGVLGEETQARIAGLNHGLGFVLFLKNGRLHLLEGFSLSGECTAGIDLGAVAFRIRREPMQRLS